MENGTFPSRNDRDRAREARVQAAIKCEVKQGSRAWKVVRLDDISVTGFRISRYPECRPELPLRIQIPGLQLLNAKICWKEGNTVGCEFAQPLHIAVFEHIIRQAEGR